MLETVIPAPEDLWFREQLLAGEDIEPILDDTIYGRLLTVFEAVRDADGNCVCYDPEYDGYVADVIIFSKYRGKGYGAQGLKLLCSAAKESGLSALYDDIAIDNPAIGLFLKQGLYETGRTDEKIILKKDL